MTDKYEITKTDGTTEEILADIAFVSDGRLSFTLNQEAAGVFIPGSWESYKKVEAIPDGRT